MPIVLSQHFNHPHPYIEIATAISDYSIVTHRKYIAKYKINPRISADWSTTKPIAPFSCTPRVQEVHPKPEVVHPIPGYLGLVVIFNTQALQIGVRPKPIAPISCTPRVHEAHTKPEVVRPIPGHQGLVVIFNTRAYEIYCKI